jgi:putative peptidoglycan lipid II flippase
MISALLFFRNNFDTPAHSLAIGVSIAGIAQFIWLYVGCKRAGLPILLKLPKMNPEVKRLLKLMIPGIIGAGIVQINIWVDIVIGTLVPKAISYLYYADRINQLPLGVIGVAVGVALLPLLSKHTAQGKKQEVVDTVNKALGFSLFLVVPAAIGSIVMALPIITILFERGAFDNTAAVATSYGLMAYAFGLPSFVILKVLTPVFFAAHDTKTPVKIAAISLVINIVLNLTFVFTFKEMGFYPHVGIALATGVAGWVNVWLLARILSKDGRFAPDSLVKIKILKTIFCSFIMALVLFGLQKIAGNYLEKAEFERVFIFAIIFGLGIAIFFGLAILTKTISVKELKNLRKKK